MQSSPVKNNETVPLPQRCKLFLKEASAILALGVAFCLLFRAIIFNENTFYFRDILYYAYPMKHFIWESFQQGTLPFWQPDILGGVPFLALMHPGVFYPFSALFFLNDFNSAFNIFYMAQHWMLAVGSYALCRYWGISIQGALGASLIALLGGYFLSISSFHNHLQSAVWLPFIFFSFQNFLQTGKMRYFLATVLTLTFQVLGGSPENCLFTVALLLPFSLFIIPKNGGIDATGKRILYLAAAIVFALGLSACQTLPTYFMMEHSTRAHGMSYETSVRWSMDWAELNNFLLPVNFKNFMIRPHLNWDYFLQSPYMGLLPVLFLISAILFYPGRVFLFWVTVCIAGIFFALGNNNLLYIHFFNNVPGFDHFRYPEKFLFLSAFALVFLTGYGIDRLPNALKQRKFLFQVIVLAMGIGIITISLANPGRGIILPLIALPVLAIGVHRIHKNKLKTVHFQWLLVFLLFADLSYRNISLIPTIDRSYYESAPKLLPQIANETEQFRIYSGDLSSKTLHSKQRFPWQRTHYLISLTLKEQLYPNLSGIYGVESVDGKTGIRLQGPEQWVQHFTNSLPETRRTILERSNVHKWVTMQNQRVVASSKTKSATNTRTPPPLGRVDLKTIETFANPLPRSYVVAHVQQTPADEILGIYYDPNFDPRRTALVEETVALPDSGMGSGMSHPPVYRPNGASIFVQTEGGGYLVLVDNYFPGWTAKVNGKETPIHRTNRFYRGVLLEPGANRVEFQFVPEGFRAGILVSLLTLFILIWRIFTPRHKSSQPV
jgi:hypothetical protein